MSHEVALDLRSKTGSGDIASDLFGLRRRVRNGNFKYEHHRALSHLVVKQASDVDVWNAVYDLITTVSRTTPPTSIPVSFDGTPNTSSSASQQGGEQTQKLVEGRVFEEIRGCTYQNVEGFFSKYFEGKPLAERTLWYVQCSICGLFNASYVAYSMLHTWPIQCFVCGISNAPYVVYSVLHMSYVAYPMLHMWPIQCSICSLSNAPYVAYSMLHM